MNKPSINHLLILLLTPLLWGCASKQPHNSHPPLNITVSIEPQRALVEEIAGERADVAALLKGGADPETYDPTFAAMMRLERNDACFLIGNMEFENQLKAKLSPKATARMVDTSVGLELLEGSHQDDSHDHSGHSHDIDPHTWSSPRNLKLMADVIYQTLCQLDPEGEEYYTQRKDALVCRLDSLDNAWADRLAPLKGTSFMMWHPSLSYFAHDYGLHQISVSAEHKETTPGKLRSIISMTDEKPVVFFTQKGYDPRISAIVTESLGIPIVEFNPLDHDWQTQLENVVNAITSHSQSPLEK